MGCGPSINDMNVFYPNISRKFELIGLKEKDILRYFKLYDGICKHQKPESDMPKISSVLTYLKVPQVAFIVRSLSISKSDDSTYCIPFPEFVYFLWNFCTLSREEVGNDVKTTRV